MSDGPAAAKPVATRDQTVAVSAAFLALFAIVGFALYGLPFFYDFFVKRPGLDAAAGHVGQRATASSSSAVVFGLMAGIIVDRFGPRRLMLVGHPDGGGGAHRPLDGVTDLGALLLLLPASTRSATCCGGPLPNQVLLSRWFDAGARQGHGHRLPRDRHRRRARAAGWPTRSSRRSAGAAPCAPSACS